MNRTVLKREIVSIIHNQALGAILVQVCHEWGLAGAPRSAERQAKRRVELFGGGDFSPSRNSHLQAFHLSWATSLLHSCCHHPAIVKNTIRPVSSKRSVTTHGPGMW